MEKIHTKKYIGTPFTVKSSTVKNAPGTWDSTKISVYRDEILIGEYIRNYSDFSILTFYPFRVGDDWYALYSPHYTSTRVLRLHEDKIEDWCGEDPQSTGFCPVEFYVPRFNRFSKSYEGKNGPTTYTHYLVDSETKDDQEFVDDWADPTFDYSAYCDFGFLCGCVWGDDTSWKLRHIDLSKVPQKELIITEKFGYWELPTRLTLRQCIDMSCWEPSHHWVGLTKTETINFDTNERS